jgi:hypothetical protein
MCWRVTTPLTSGDAAGNLRYIVQSPVAELVMRLGPRDTPGCRPAGVVALSVAKTLLFPCLSDFGEVWVANTVGVSTALA